MAEPVMKKEALPPYCKGCGHLHVARSLSQALERLGLGPQRVALVSDIGCVGLVDSLFLTHTIHTLHGRSTAVATGIELAGSLLDSSELKTVVMIGDGGATIGLLHLVEAARMNVDITVLLHNNFLYGMTGGQHSALTPLEFLTSTTRSGNFIPPMDLCTILGAAGAGFLARALATDTALADLVAQAIAHQGFSLVEIFGLCTGYATRYNERLTTATLKADLHTRGILLGIMKKEVRPAFAELYRSHAPSLPLPPPPIPHRFDHTLASPLRLILAGSAGEGVQSAAYLLTVAAGLSGLWSAQKNDNPVTVGTGFSTSELTLSPEPIGFTGVERPDAVIVTSREGMDRVSAQAHAIGGEGVLLVDLSLPVPSSSGRVIRKAFRQAAPTMPSLAAVAAFLRARPLFPLDALIEAVRGWGRGGDRAFQAVEAGAAL